MNDGISPVRYIPPIQRLYPKGKSDDKKGDGEGEQRFQEHIPDKDKDAMSSDHNQGGKEFENTDSRKQGNENSLQTGKDHDPDDICGSIIDTEV